MMIPLMAVEQFPINPGQTVGRFWLAGAEPDRQVDGYCRVDRQGIEVDVASPLTDWMQRDGDLNRAMLRPREEEDDFAVHGAIPIRPGNVTFLGVRTTSRRATLGFGDRPEHQRMRSTWCVAGAHVDSDARFAGVMVRFSHLELWAKTEGLSLKFEYKPSTKVKLQFDDPESIECWFAEYGELAARLRLTTAVSFDNPNEWGGELKTKNWLELADLSGWTLKEALDRFVRPIQTLLSLLAGERCTVTDLEVLVDGDLWCPVYGSLVDRDVPLPQSTTLLVDRTSLSLEVLAAWCPLSRHLSPTPQVIAGAFSGAFQTVDAEALALTATAEGLDRSLYAADQSQRFDSDKVSTSIAALENADMPSDVRDVLSSSLKLFLADFSYPMRMRRLGEAVGDVAPACVGNVARWKTQITDLRISLAHALTEERADPDVLLNMHALVLSMRWTMLFRLLIEVGVPRQLLTDAALSSESLQRDARFWRNQLPKIFA